MKVLVTGTRGFPGVQGGVETHCEQLYPRLARLGCRVGVFRRTPYLPEPRQRTYRGVRFLDLWCPRVPCLEAFVHTLASVVLAGLRRADLLHVHSVGPGLCVPIARLLGMKVVLTVQGADYERKKWGPLARAMLRLGERLGARNANRTIAVSQHVQELLHRRHGIKAACIPNGVDVPSFPASSRCLAKWGLEPGRYVFAIGRLEPGKGFDELIDAFSGLQVDWKLAIAGRADHPSTYSRDLEARVGRAERVVLTGFVQGEELAQLYAHCGLFVLPSHHEGLPIALLEALSYGCSVLASDIPANRAVPLRPDRYFEMGSAEDLREKAAGWIERGISKEEKQQNLRLLREQYDWDVVVRQTLDVYREVVGGNG